MLLCNFYVWNVLNTVNTSQRQQYIQYSYGSHYLTSFFSLQLMHPDKYLNCIKYVLFMSIYQRTKKSPNFFSVCCWFSQCVFANQ